LRVIDLGLIDYRDALAQMKTVLSARINGEIEDTLLLCEHPPVYTVGRTRDAAKNIINPHNVPIVEVARGGDVTFHGPGQIVGYPIFQLPDNRHDLHGFMRGLEEMMIRTLSHLGVSVQRDARNTGVWIEGAKVMAIGISARRWVIWHGFALNLDTDLAYFQRINPCGMGSDTVTRLVDHTQTPPSRKAMTALIVQELERWWEDWTAAPG